MTHRDDGVRSAREETVVIAFRKRSPLPPGSCISSSWSTQTTRAADCRPDMSRPSCSIMRSGSASSLRGTMPPSRWRSCSARSSQRT